METGVVQNRSLTSGRDRCPQEVVRINITMPAALKNHLAEVVNARCYPSASAYFQECVRRDVGLAVPGSSHS